MTAVRRRALALFALAAGCAPKVAPPGLPVPLPVPRADGVIAGPHYLVDAPPPPPVPADVPGQGSLPPYVSLVRRTLADRIRPCSLAPGSGARVALTLAADGTAIASQVVRSSGDDRWDGCLESALAGGGFPAPPAELLVDGVFATDLVFR